MRLTMRCENKNQQEIKEFSNWLLKVGDGLIENNLNGESKIEISMDMIVPDFKQAFDELIDFVFLDLVYLDLDNLYVEEGNIESHLEFFGSKVFNALNCSSLSPRKLTLKIGVSVMLLRNID
ncbi:hypothetical protein Ahy_A02g007124 [Arachis hypogaea]|uniref:DNA helicase Pif1-like 2B domain-containing protein n=1 Tax=Arachis hypogaea TaxID=3818 RepID=A0A445EBU8_ARAHY|nr:hypothetical protein Ahy_A02g007124 [Arachis hypogaea]